MSEAGTAPPLVLTLTRACNLRCGFCPLVLGRGNMSPALAKKAASVYLKLFPRGKLRVRFFGGEPLLRFRTLRGMIERYPWPRQRAPRFSFPTNGTKLTPDVLKFLKRRPDVEAAVSRVRDAPSLARLPNVLVNLYIPPDGAGSVGTYLARLLRAGLYRVNFLPVFYKPWRAAALRDLERSFRVAAGLILAARDAGRPVEVRNLSVLSPAPLFNHGMVVDVDGDVFPSNIVLCSPFERLRPSLRLGSVLEPERLDIRKADGVDWDAAMRECLDARAYRSTARVDELLTGFVRELERGGLGGAR